LIVNTQRTVHAPDERGHAAPTDVHLSLALMYVLPEDDLPGGGVAHQSRGLGHAQAHSERVYGLDSHYEVRLRDPLDGPLIATLAA
jgi:hypothetical protein